jgi:hypothetical protein
MNRTVFWSIAAMVSIGLGVHSYFSDDYFTDTDLNSSGANAEQVSATFPSAEEAAASSTTAAEAMSEADAFAPVTPDAATIKTGAAKISQLALDAKSDDADQRAAAIDQLALAPRTLAIPVLQGLLSATDEHDRQLVLNALHTLALDQGDADGAIREMLRLTIYDGDDARVADNALIILDSIQQEPDVEEMK